MGTVADIANEEYATLKLRIDRVECPEDHTSIAQYLHTCDKHGTHLKLTVFNDNPGAESDFTEGSWYEVGDLRPDIYQGTIGASPARGCTFTSIEQPTDDAGVPDGTAGQGGTFQQVYGSSGRVALDIETIQHVTDDEVRSYRDSHEYAVNPDHFSLVCVGLAYQPSPTPQLPSPPVAEHVVFAGDESDREQARAIGEVAACLYAWDADTLLTYGGHWFDLPVLTALWKATTEAHPENTDGSMPLPVGTRQYYHADLSRPAMHWFGPSSLDEAVTACDAGPAKSVQWQAYTHELDLASWRREYDAEHDDQGSWASPDQDTIVGTDILYLGEQYLNEGEINPTARAALEAMLADYAVDDVRPLFRMARDDRFAGHPALPIDIGWE